MPPVLGSANSYHGNGLDHEQTDSQAQDVLQGLLAEQKCLPSKYLYDARGSKLFERICTLPEYYLTRTELGLLLIHAVDIVREFSQGDMVELGAGANWKMRILLNAFNASARASVRYVPVDVCRQALMESTAQLRTVYPEVRVQAIEADFTCDLHKLKSDRPKLLLFLGSTIGNLDKRDTLRFLREVAAILNPGDRFLLGLDMVKPPDIIHDAYNDSQNVTAEFNKNILSVINRQFGANFRPGVFEHLAFYNVEKERAEMHLRALEQMFVDVKALGITVELKKGETIRTEICRKFRRDDSTRMIRNAGLEVGRWYSDHRGWFSLVEVVTTATTP